MHEMSLCEGIRQIIEGAAEREKFSRVKRVRVEVGRFSGVEPEALRFGFDVVMRNSVAEGAELDLIELPGEAFCFDCCETVALNARLDPCPKCGGTKLTATGGDDMKIKDLEVV